MRPAVRMTPLHHLSQLLSTGNFSVTPSPLLWSEIKAKALEHGLSPMLVHVAKQASVNVSTENWMPLLHTYRETAARFTLLKIAYDEINKAFFEEGIKVMWLKGIDLAQSVYPYPTLRPMNDLDMIVHFERKEAALSLAQKIGYRFNPNLNRLFAPEDRISLATGHDYALLGGPMRRVALELHYHLMNYKVLDLDGMSWFWEQEREQDGISTLRPEAHLLYLCAHSELQHSKQQFFLLRYLDLHLLITQYEMNWSLIIRQAVKFRWTYAVSHALEVAEEYFGTQLPTGLLKTLREQRLPSENVAQLIKFQRRDGNTLDVLRSYLPQLTLVDRLRVIWRLIFPPETYMRQIYSIPLYRPIWIYYPYRWVIQFYKGIRALRGYWRQTRHHRSAK